MRRFYGYLICIVSALLIVLSGSQYQIRNTEAGLEYDGGYETVYKVDVGTSNLELSQIADICYQRIEDAGVSNASVEYEYGQDESDEDSYIRIKQAASTEKDADYVLRSVEATGKITISTVMDSGENVKEIEEPFEIGTAEVEWDSSTPYVTVDVKDGKEMKNFIEVANKAYEEMNGGGDDSSDSDDDVSGLIVVWLDKQEDDSYLAIKNETNPVKKQEMEDRVLTVVPTDNFISEQDSSGAYTKKQLKITSYDYDQNTLVAKSAHTLERILNYTPANYKLTRLYTTHIDATQASNYVKMILIGICVAAALLLIYLVIRFRLAGLGAWSTVASSLFLQLVIFNFFEYTFTTMVAVGFLVSLIANGIFAIVYLDKFKDEVLKGKTVAKSNSEARKYSLVSIIDITVLVLFISIVSVLSVSAQIKLLPATMIIGIGCSLVLNRLLTSLFMYLFANNTLVEQKKNLLGVKAKDVPNIMELEPQKKVNPLSKFNPLKHGKVATIITSAFSAVSVVLIVTFAIVAACIPSFNLFNETTETKPYSRIEIECELVGTHYVFETKKATVEWFNENFSKYKFSEDDVEIVVEEDVAISGKEDRVDMAYISISLDQDISNNYDYYDDLSTKLSKKQAEAKGIVTTAYKQSANYLIGQTLILFAIMISLSVVFILFRYGYKYALSSLSVLLPSSLVTFAFLAATRLEISSLSLVGIAVGVVILVISELPFFEKIKKLRRENRDKQLSYDEVKNITLEATHTTMFVTLTTLIISLVFTLVMLLFSPFTYSVTSTYLIIMIMLVFGIITTLFVFVPVYLYCEKNIKYKPSNRSLERNKKRMEKAKLKNKNKGSEAKEAIIPGIND